MAPGANQITNQVTHLGFLFKLLRYECSNDAHTLRHLTTRHFSTSHPDNSPLCMTTRHSDNSPLCMTTRHSDNSPLCMTTHHSAWQLATLHDNSPLCMTTRHSAWQLTTLHDNSPLGMTTRHHYNSSLRRCTVYGEIVWWWNSERFVVITRQLQAVKCSLSCQLFRHIFDLLDFDTVAFNVKKHLLDLYALHWIHVLSNFC
jgi:hypothetical protein